MVRFPMLLALLAGLLLVGGAPWLASSAEAAATVLRPSARPAKGEQGASNFEREPPFRKKKKKKKSFLRRPLSFSSSSTSTHTNAF